MNSAHAIRGPKYVVEKGQDAVPRSDEARQHLEAIDTDSLNGRRDRALIGVIA